MKSASSSHKKNYINCLIYFHILSLKQNINLFTKSRLKSQIRMGKGFKNYISRWFHPTNVEQKSAGEKKRQQELRDQYERVFSNKELMGDEKSRLGLAFMYNTPAGYKGN